MQKLSIKEVFDSEYRVTCVSRALYKKKSKWKLAICLFIHSSIHCFTGRLLIADTNNSVIRYLDLNKTVPKLLTLELKGVQPPKKSKSPKRLRRRAPSDAQTIKVDGISSSEGNLSIKISLPKEYHFSKVQYLFTRT